MSTAKNKYNFLTRHYWDEPDKTKINSSYISIFIL
jgi:hypothetical protein